MDLETIGGVVGFGLNTLCWCGVWVFMGWAGWIIIQRRRSR